VARLQQMAHSNGLEQQTGEGGGATFKTQRVSD